MSSDNGSGGIPWAMNLILVSLQADKPPAGKTHGKTSQDAAKNGTNHGSFPAASGDGHA